MNLLRSSDLFTGAKGLARRVCAGAARESAGPRTNSSRAAEGEPATPGWRSQAREGEFHSLERRGSVREPTRSTQPQLAQAREGEL
jgi:hypothetical protein